MEIERIFQLPSEFSKLLEESILEEFGALEKLKRNFENGSNTFSKQGEALFSATFESELLGICGLNVDPYVDDPTIGRVRHLYVSKLARRQGVGSKLVEAVEHQARKHFNVLRLYTGDAKASAFYTSIGFSPVSGNHVSHIKYLGDRQYFANSVRARG